MTGDELIEIEDLENANEFELKHFPTLTVEGDKAIVEVGKSVPHPQRSRHHIFDIRLYLDDEQIGSRKLASEERSVVEFNIEGVSGDLHAVANCSLHGVWKSHVISI